MIFVNELQYKDLSGIYKITNMETGYIYIGQTKQPFEKRYMHHRWQLRNGLHDNSHMQSSFNKHGEQAFVFEVVEVIDKNDDDKRNAAEIMYINQVRETGKCYNIADGGDGAKGVPMSEENRKFFSELNRKLNIGKKASEETKKKMSASRKKYYSEHPVPKERGEKAYKTRSESLTDGTCCVNKLSADDVYKIKQMLVDNVKQKDIAKLFNVHQTNIAAINNEVSWSFIKVPGWEQRTIKRKPNRKPTLCQASNEEGATTISNEST